MSLTQINKAGLDELALDHVFTIGASGTDHYTFQGEGLNGTVNDPTLYLTRGKTYRFENGTGSHPIRIQSTSGASGTAYNTGVTNNAGSGTVIVEVQHDAPDVLYYQCTSHANMNGILYITGALADGGVTTAKLADDAVTSAKIADNAITTDLIANGNITNVKLNSNSVDSNELVASSVTTAKIADEAVTLAKLPHGTSSNDGKFLRANNGADPTFETVSGTTINNNADNRVITGSGTANTLNGESTFVYDTAENGVGIGIADPTPTASYYQGAFLHLHQAASGGSVGSQLHLTTDNTGSAAGDGSQISAYSSSLYINNQENGDTYFYNNGSSNLTIKANGNVGINTQSPSDKLHVNGTSLLGGNTYLTSNTYISSNKGIYFDGGTGSANYLDDYEEGTWTPTNGNFTTWSISSSQIIAYYTKIGSLVTCWFEQNGGQIAWSTPQWIGGLPFSVAQAGTGSFTNNYPNAGGEILVYYSERLYFAQSDGYNTNNYRAVYTFTYRTTS